MANEIAALGLKVDADGVISGIKSLDDLAAAGPRVERAMEAVADSAGKAGKSLKSLSEGSSRGIDEVARVAPRSADGLGRIARSADDAQESIAKMNLAASDLSSSLDFERAQVNIDQTRTSLISLAGAAATAGSILAGAFGINQLKAYADTWSDLQSRVGAATQDMGGAANQMTRLVEIANASYSSLEQTVSAYAGNIQALKDLGRSSEQAADYTESLNHMLVLTATRGERAASVQYALSKAMAVGKLETYGLQAVLANGGEVASALAAELGTTVSGLRALASDGKITGQVIADAIIKPLDEVRVRAAEMPATVADAFTRVTTNTTELVGVFDKLTGASAKVADTVIGVADGLRDLSKNEDSLNKIAAAGGTLIEVGTVLSVVLGARLAGAAAASGASFVAANVQAIAYQVTLARMAGVSGIASAAMAAMGGPVGLVVAGLGLAALAWSKYGESAKNNADEGVQSLINAKGSIDDLIEGFNKLNDLQRQTTVSLKSEELTKATAAVSEAVQDLSNAYKPFTGSGMNAVRKFNKEFSAEITSLAQNTSLSSDEMATAFANLIDKFIESGKGYESQRDGLVQMAQRVVEAASKVKGLTTEVDALTAAQRRNLALTGAYTEGMGNSPVVAKLNADLRASVSAAFEATKSLKPLSEQMAEVRANGDLARTALQKLIDVGEGTSANADKLRGRIAANDAQLAKMAKSGSNAAGGLKKLENAYQTLSNRAQEYVITLRQEAAQGGKVTNAQKMQIQLDELLASSKSKVSKAALQALQNSIKTAAGLEAEAAAAADAAKAYEDGLKWKAEWYAAQGKNLEEIKSANDRIREEIQLIGLSQDAQQALERARIEATLAVREQHLAEMQRANDANEFSSRDQQNLEMEIALLKERLGLLDDKRVRTANVEAAKELEAQWDKTSQTIGDTLADYIMGGGKNAAQYLKRLFSTLVLQPVVQTVVGSVFGLGGSGAAAGQLGQLGQLGNLASGFSNLVNAFGKGAAGAASSAIGKAVPMLYDAGFKSVAQGLGAFQAGMASQQSIAAFTSSLKAGGAQMAGTIAGAVMNGFAGYGISKLISGGYEVNKYVNKIAGIASAIPGVGLIAGVIGGAINRLFGRKLKDTGIEGTFGGESGFVGNTYEFYKGGLFRSDKTKRSPLDESIRQGFADYYGGMLFNTQSLGSVLGLDSSGLSNFSSGIKLSLKGLSAEEQQAKINEELERVQNELAQQVIGTMVTQASKTEAGALYAQWTASGLANRLYSDRSIDNPTAHLDDEDRQLLEKVSGFLNISTSGGIAFLGNQIGSRLAQQAAAPDTYTPSEYALADEKAIETLSRLANSLTTVNAVLEELNGTLYAGSLAGADMAYKLSELFGGLEGFTAATSSFYENFFSEEEKRAKLQEKLSDAFSAIDLTLPDIDASNAREQYRKLAEAQDLATESGREAWAVIMQLGDAFASITPTLEEAAQAAQAIAQLWMDLENRALAVQDKYRTPQQRMNAQYDSIAGGLIGAGLSTMQQGDLSSLLMQSSKDEIYALAQEVWSLGHLSIEARNALLDAADALADLKDAAQQQRDGLMATLWQMTGNVQALREKELEALDPANRALQAMIYTLGDLQNAAAEAAQKTQAAWSSWSTASGLALQYTGDTSGLQAQAAILRAQLGSAGVVDTAKLQELIGIEQALFNVQKQKQEEAQRLQAQITQERLNGLRDELAAARALADAAKRLGDYARDLYSSGASGLSESDRMAALFAEYGALKTSARAGNVDAFGRLQSVTGDYLGLASTLAASGSDYSITAGRMAAELEALAKAQELVGQSQATGIEMQMEQLTAQTQIAQEQFEVSSTVRGLIAKSMQEQSDIWDRENSQQEKLLSLQEQAALYLANLPVDFGKTMSPLISGAASNIARPIADRLDLLMGYFKASSEDSGAVRVPAYAVGTNVVPRDMLAQIHAGEAIIPKAFNPWAGGAGFSFSGAAADSALVAEIRALREQNTRLEARLQGIERSSQQLADQFDSVTVGGNAMAVEVMA